MVPSNFFLKLILMSCI